MRDIYGSFGRKEESVWEKLWQTFTEIAFHFMWASIFGLFVWGALFGLTSARDSFLFPLGAASGFLASWIAIRFARKAFGS
jgi:hypothetical protein